MKKAITSRLLTMSCLAAAVFMSTQSIGAADAASASSANPTGIGLLARAPSIQAQHLPAAVTNGLAQRVGSVTGSQQLKLGIALPTRNQAELNLLLQNLNDPQSPQFHQYLSPEEFTARFSPSQADYDAVIAWAQASGLTVTGTSPNRRLIDIEADANTVNRAFNVTMTEYQHPSEDRSFISADREPTTSGLDIPLLQITGLNNFVTPRPHLHKGKAPIANATGSGPSGQFLPSDIRAAYYGSGSLTGSGQSIGILSFDGYKTSDVSLYYSSTGMSSSVPINNVLVNGYSGACVSFNSDGTINSSVCDDGEQILDIVNAIGMAPGISQILFYEGDPSDASADTKILNKMVTDNLAKVLSCSWGWGANQATDDSIFQQMAAQGQSFLSASGDSGAWGVGSSSTVNAQYPSQSQYVIQVGGTDLTTNGAGGAWASETAWGNSGGGWDSTAPIPSWQQLSGVINSSNKGSTSYRNAPDVAMEANFDNPTVSNGQFLTGYGGTSFAAPRWAGFVALINQQSVANGHGTVGFFNSTLYNVGVGSSYSSNFHDITSGSNPAINSSGTVISGGPSFNAVAGYDLVTGWGSPKAAFITTLAGSGGGTGGTPTANFSFTTSGLTANFTDSSTDAGGTIGSHSWNFGDGATSTATNPSHTYASGGSYTVTETVADSVNTSATNTKTSTVTVSGGTGGGNVLQNGVGITIADSVVNHQQNWTMVVPAGATNLSFTMSGGTGDADLYVKFGSAPTLTTYDCRPYVTGNNESCPITTAQAGTYYVMVNSYAAYSGVTLKGSYTAPGSGGTPTANFTFTTSGLSATFTDSSTDSGGSIGTYSWNFGDSSTSTATNPSHTYTAAGSYTVTETVADSVNTSATSTKTSTVTVSGGTGGGNVLSNGVPVTGLSGTSGMSSVYTFTVPAGATNVSIAISGGSGDADMYVKAGSAPTLSSYDCRPYVTGNNETCGSLSAGVTYYVSLNAYAAYSGVSLVGNYTTGGGGGNVLTNGVPVTGLSGSSGTLSADYTLTVPANKTSVTISISGGTGDADMYVKLGSAPTTSTYDCRPYVTGNNETCTFTPPAAGGVYHVKLNAYATYSGVSLTGSFN